MEDSEDLKPEESAGLSETGAEAASSGETAAGPAAATTGRSRLPAYLALFVVVLGLIVGLQAANGVYGAEFGGHPDEAAHYVTGLMIRDYIAGHLGEHPMRFAESYYDHYPKVAIGHWPPGFYVYQAAWTLPFGVSRLSICLLMGLTTALCAVMVGIAVAVSTKRFAVGAAAAVVFAALPLSQRFAGMIMAEMPLLLVCAASTYCWYRYLRKPGWLWSIAFGATAAAAILTKGSAIGLALVPLISILYCRKWAVLKLFSLWLAPVVVVLVAGPWMAFTHKITAKAMVGTFGPAFTMDALRYYGHQLWLGIGPLLVLFAIVGLVALCRPRERTAVDGCLLGLGLGMLAVVVIIPAGIEGRYLIPILPMVIWLAAVGVEAAATLLKQPSRVTVVATVLLLAGLLPVARLAPKSFQGMSAVADQLVTDQVERPGKVLVSSDAKGEGALIAEMAMRDRSRPSYVVKRASKELAESDWLGRDYEASVGTVAQLRQKLGELEIRYLVEDGSLEEIRRQPHHAIVADLASRGTASDGLAMRRKGRDYRVRVVELKRN